MPLGQQWKEVMNYLHHHRGERRAVLAFAFCCLALIALKIYLGHQQSNAVSQLDAITLQAVETLVDAEPYTENNYERNAPASYAEWRKPREAWASATLQPKPFDPNTVSGEELLQMGLSEKTVSNLLRYREKGGRFRQADDLRKLYSLKPKEADQLIPYVDIIPADRKATEPTFVVADAPVADKKPAFRNRIVDINRSDTADWIALPGIGSKLANRIVNFRDKLGGFYAVEQVAECYGLPDSTYQKIRPLLTLGDAAMLKKINLNTVSTEELAQHPYVRFAMAKAIVAYRTQHGAFEATEQLKRIMIVDDAFYNKLFPYLQAGPTAANER